MWIDTFVQTNGFASGTLTSVFGLYEEVVLFSLNDYDDHLHTALLARARTRHEPECNRHIRANRNLVRAYCLMRLLGFFDVDAKLGLKLDFSRVLARLDYFVRRSYADFYMVARHYVCNPLCAELVLRMPKSSLHRMLAKAAISDRITGKGVFDQHMLSRVTRVSVSVSKSRADDAAPSPNSRLKRYGSSATLKTLSLSGKENLSCSQRPTLSQLDKEQFLSFDYDKPLDQGPSSDMLGDRDENQFYKILDACPEIAGLEQYLLDTFINDFVSSDRAELLRPPADKECISISINSHTLSDQRKKPRVISKAQILVGGVSQ